MTRDEALDQLPTLVASLAEAVLRLTEEMKTIVIKQQAYHDLLTEEQRQAFHAKVFAIEMREARK